MKISPAEDKIITCPQVEIDGEIFDLFELVDTLRYILEPKKYPNECIPDEVIELLKKESIIKITKEDNVCTNFTLLTPEKLRTLLIKLETMEDDWQDGNMEFVGEA